MATFGLSGPEFSLLAKPVKYKKFVPVRGTSRNRSKIITNRFPDYLTASRTNTERALSCSMPLLCNPPWPPQAKNA